MNRIDPGELSMQLGKPSGKIGKLLGEKMNESNIYIYSFIFSNIDFKDKENILEIGFGNGRFFPMYFKNDRDIKVTGIDISDVMIEEASLFNKKLLKDKKLFLKLEDSGKMSFPDESFDKIITINTIYFLEPLGWHINEIKRVLKKGGTLIIGFTPKSILENWAFIKDNFKLYEAKEIVTLLKMQGFINIREFSQDISKKTVDGKLVNSTVIYIQAEK